MPRLEQRLLPKMAMLVARMSPASEGAPQAGVSAAAAAATWAVM